MSLIRINHNPSRRQLVVFGLCWLLCFGCLGIVFLRRGDSGTMAAIICTVAFIIPVVGSAVPKFMRLLYIGMAYLAFPIGFLISYLILGAVYYLVLTPTGLLMRLFGYDPLKRRFESNVESYWVPRKTPTDLKSYFHQY
jgi:hypothetical protein